MLHEDRSRAQSFGAVAAQYDRARPSYPPALIDAVLAGGVRSVLDAGCGTGIAAVLLARRGCAVLGVEPDVRMAQIARAKGLEVEVARFEDWNARGRRFDLVSSAQAWHWIEPRIGAARAGQVLRARGRVALFWNFGNPPARVRRALAPIYARLGAGLESYSVLLGNRDRRVDDTLAGIAGCGAFEPAHGETFTWSRRYGTAAWLEQLGTHSDHRALAPARRKALLATVGDAIDALGGSFRMTYETVLISAQRL